MCLTHGNDRVALESIVFGGHRGLHLERIGCLVAFRLRLHLLCLQVLVSSQDVIESFDATSLLGLIEKVRDRIHLWTSQVGFDAELPAVLRQTRDEVLPV